MPSLEQWNKYGKSNCCCANMMGIANQKESWGTCLNCKKESEGHFCQYKPHNKFWILYHVVVIGANVYFFTHVIEKIIKWIR